MAEEVVLLGGKGEEERAQNACAELNEEEKDSEGKDASEEEFAAGDGENGEDEDVENVGEEQIPLVDSDCSHDDEGIDDVEGVIACLRPEGTMEGSWREGVIGRKEKERDDEGWECDGSGDLHDTLGLVV